MTTRKHLLMGVLATLICVFVGSSPAVAVSATEVVAVSTSVSVVSTTKVVAVIDTGYSSNCVATADQVTPAGHNFLGTADNEDLTTTNNHGCNVAATAVNTCKQDSQPGMPPDICKIMMIKATDGVSMNVKDAAEAFDWAVQNGADVINLSSWTETLNPADASIVTSACMNAVAHGVTVVLIAGNAGRDDAQGNLWASGCPTAIRVAALQSNNSLQPESNHGPLLADIAATASSTSYAAPQVAADAALVLAVHDGLSPEQVKNVLHYGTPDVPTNGVPTPNGCTPLPIDVGWHCKLNGPGAVLGAGYVIPRFKLTTVVSGHGTISGNGNSECKTSCVGNYDTGMEVPLSAEPAPGYAFTGWSGACTGKGDCTVTMTANMSVTAAFAPRYRVVKVIYAHSGNGKVVFAIAKLPRALAGTQSYKYGVIVVLKAMPAKGWVFAGWTGDCKKNGKKPTCTLRLMKPTYHVGANFASKAKAAISK